MGGARQCVRHARPCVFFHYNSVALVEIGPSPRPTTRYRWLSLGEHPAGFVHDGDCAYVIHTAVECTGRGAIVGVPLVEGATCARLDVPVNGLQPRPFVADADRFYWVSDTCPERDDAAQGIYAVDRATGVVTAFAPGERVSGLQRGASGLYWINHRGVYNSDLTSRDAREVFVGGAHCLLVEGGTLYICRDEGVSWRNEGASDDHLVAGTSGVKEIAVDARHLYWLTPTGDLVRIRRP